jgi:hypothetical protein
MVSGIVAVAVVSVVVWPSHTYGIGRHHDAAGEHNRE